MAWEPYEEKYIFNIKDMWTKTDGESAIYKPSKWEFTTDRLKGHTMAMLQSG